MIYDNSDGSSIFMLVMLCLLLAVFYFIGSVASTDYMFSNCIVTDINGQQTHGEVYASELKISVVDANGIEKIMPKEAVKKIEVAAE